MVFNFLFSRNTPVKGIWFPFLKKNCSFKLWLTSLIGTTWGNFKKNWDPLHCFSLLAILCAEIILAYYSILAILPFGTHSNVNSIAVFAGEPDFVLILLKPKGISQWLGGIGWWFTIAVGLFGNDQLSRYDQVILFGKYPINYSS